MTKVRTIALLAAIAAVFVVAAYGVAYVVATRSSAGSIEPTPLAGDGAVPVPSSDLPDADSQVAFWANRAAGRPEAYIDLTYLGQAYARKARETSDVGYYVRAQAALRRALRANPNYVPARASLSTVLFSLHEFGPALRLARPILDDPRGIPALATFGDAHLALGSYGRAQAAYNRLLAFGASPAAYSRLAFLADLRGDEDAALALLDRAARLAHASGEYGESLAWYQFQLGEVAFRAGRIELAESRYRAARRLFPGSPPALGGLAKAKAAQGRYDEAIGLYRRATGVVPQPELLAALGDVYAAKGLSAQAREQYATVEVIGRLAGGSRQLFNRQLANFYADHGLRPGLARRLALAELRVRKDVYGYDAAAWAAFKAGRIDEAQRFSRRALALGTRDAELLYHAGLIARDAGRHDEARALLADALELNPSFDPLQAPLARSALEALT